MKAFRRILILCCLLSVALAAAALAEAGALNLPAGLKTIDDEAFAGLSDAAGTVVVPEGVETVGARAFAESALSEIQLPATVRSIGAEAFKNCGPASADKRYYLFPESVSVGAGALDGNAAIVTLGGAELPYLTYTVAADGVTVTGVQGELSRLIVPKPSMACR